MKEIREAHFSGIFCLSGAGNLAIKSAGYGILENFGLSEVHNHSGSYLLF